MSARRRGGRARIGRLNPAVLWHRARLLSPVAARSLLLLLVLSAILTAGGYEWANASSEPASPSRRQPGDALSCLASAPADTALVASVTYVYEPASGSASPSNIPVYVMDKEQWERYQQRSSTYTPNVRAADYLEQAQINDGCLFIPTVSTLADSLYLVLLDGNQGIATWWTFDWAGPGPELQELYVYPDRIHWTDVDNDGDGRPEARWDIEGYRDVQSYFLRPPEVILAPPFETTPLVLVHGLHGTDRSLGKLADSLMSQGYEVWQFHYPHSQDVRYSAALLADALDQVLSRHQTMTSADLVGHSLGGFVIRTYVQGMALAGGPGLSRTVSFNGDARKVVILGTPNHGARSGNLVLAGELESALWENGKRCAILPGIFGMLSRDKYEPAYKQIALASTLVWDLNARPFPDLGGDSGPTDDYLVVSGDWEPLRDPALGDCPVEEGDPNDLFVAVSSASLLRAGIPLVIVNKHHGGLVGTGLLGGSATETARIIAEFLGDQLDAGDTGMFKHYFSDSQQAFDAGYRNAMVLVKYYDAQGNQAEAPIQLCSVSRSTCTNTLVPNYGEDGSVSVETPSGPTYYHYNDREGDVDWGIVIPLAGSEEEFSVPTLPDAPPFKLYAGQTVLVTLREEVAPTPPASSTSTALVIDVSGSMESTWQGGIKIESAKSAATQMVNMMEAESQVGGISHRVSVASFSSDAYLNLNLTDDHAEARETISWLSVLGNTNIGAGLTVANGELATANQSSSRFIILLSDGMTNEGLTPDQIIAGPVQDARNAGICIYTVGFGDSGDIDEDLLKRIASESACGEYYYASDAYRLESVYVEIRHRALGELIGSFTGQVAQGQTVQPGEVTVDSNRDQLAATLNWPGSSLDLILTDPTGRQVDEGYPSANIFVDARPVYFIIENPKPGVWQVAVVGTDVPEGVTSFNVLLSTREAETPIPTDNSAPILVTTAILLCLLVACVVYFTRAPAVGVWVLGAHPAGFVPLRRGALAIGRSPGCTLVLTDDKVSRNHAEIHRAAQGYRVRDLGSTNGTFVNDQRIKSQVLRDGDEIKVGDTRLRFQSRR
jgi:Mg-chelatase subunit ChlD/pimeloyl-ACP methyl ester carboxylesterase